MPSLQKYMVLAALSFGALAKDDTCTDDITIDTLNYDFGCSTVDADVTVSSSLSGQLVITGPKEFKKDFTVNGTKSLISISSDSLKTIGGKFLVQDADLLTTINLSNLTSVMDVELNRLNSLDNLQFSTDGVKASNIHIADTHISDISGLSVENVEDFRIENNNRLSMFNSNLVNITKTFILTGNGAGMQVNLTDLESAFELQISNVKSLEVPALKQVQNSIRFSQNPNLKSFEAANLTTVGSSKNGGSISFINNTMLGNISFPVLDTISGDLTVLSNPNLDEITGFPELTSVENMRLGGNFANATLPKLDDVKGTVNVTSTYNLTDACKSFESFKNKVAGKFHCEGGLDNKSANGDGSSKGKGGKGGSDGNNENAAAAPFVSTAAMLFGLVAVAAQLL